MSFIGKLHEISMYGLIVNIVCLVMGKITIPELWFAAFHPQNLSLIFLCYLFWATALYIPIAIIGAFATKYGDYGEGLTFNSDNIFVIIFAHIAEEILGLVLTPFWFLKDIFTDDLDEWKIVDYSLYLFELIFIAIGLIFLI